MCLWIKGDIPANSVVAFNPSTTLYITVTSWRSHEDSSFRKFSMTFGLKCHLVLGQMLLCGLQLFLWDFFCVLTDSVWQIWARFVCLKRGPWRCLNINQCLHVSLIAWIFRIFKSYRKIIFLLCCIFVKRVIMGPLTKACCTDFLSTWLRSTPNNNKDSPCIPTYIQLKLIRNILFILNRHLIIDF